MRRQTKQASPEDPALPGQAGQHHPRGPVRTNEEAELHHQVPASHHHGPVPDEARLDHPEAAAAANDDEDDDRRRGRRRFPDGRRSQEGPGVLGQVQPPSDSPVAAAAAAASVRV